MVKIIGILLCSIALLLSAPIDFFHQQMYVGAEPPNMSVPKYAKWGRLAIKETQKKYPNAEIIDYLHMGREEKNDQTIERFKLWLRQDNRKFGVFIIITFDTKSEKVKNISIVETDR